MTEPVPPFANLIILGVLEVGETTSEVGATAEQAPTLDERFAFCEGIARDGRGNAYEWTVYSREQWERKSSELQDLPGAHPITDRCYVDLLDDAERLAEVVVRIEPSSGLRWTQTIVPGSDFGHDVLERMRTAPAAVRSLLFSRTPPWDRDASEVSGGDTSKGGL